MTDIGNHNVFMAYAHVAHDCHIGNHTIFGNAATLGGHVTVEDYATISAFSGVHQFCRVGQHAFIGGYSVVTKDALPYAKTVGNRARIYGINTIGLERAEVLEGLDQPATARVSAICCTRTPAARSRKSIATRRSAARKCNTSCTSSDRRAVASAFAARAAGLKK